MMTMIKPAKLLYPDLQVIYQFLFQEGNTIKDSFCLGEHLFEFVSQIHKTSPEAKMIFILHKNLPNYVEEILLLTGYNNGDMVIENTVCITVEKLYCILLDADFRFINKDRMTKCAENYLGTTVYQKIATIVKNETL